MLRSSRATRTKRIGQIAQGDTSAQPMGAPEQRSGRSLPPNSGCGKTMAFCQPRLLLLDVSAIPEVMSTWLPILLINEDMMNELVLANRTADWSRLKALVLDSVSSPITRRVYNLGLD